MSKPVRLSTSLIARTKPKDRVVWLSDNDGGRGSGRLLLRIAPSGSKRFYYRHTVNGRRVTISLGPYSKNSKDGALTLEKARAMGRKYAATHLRGFADRPNDRPEGDTSSGSQKSGASLQTGASSGTVLQLCNAYVDGLFAAKKAAASDYASIVRTHIAPSAFAGIAAAKMVDPSPVVDLLSTMVASGKKRTAKKVRSILGAAYASAMRAKTDATVPRSLREFNITHNPIPQIVLRVPDGTRERALNREELTEFWRYLQTKSPMTPQLRAVRLDVLLGGQRCEQLLRVRESEVDLIEGTILLWDPKGRRDTPRRHLLPITAMAKSDVSELLKESNRVGSPFLFAGRKREKTLSPFTVTRQVTTISKELLAAGRNVKHPFSYLDIRRTIESHMQALHIDDEVREHIQSHGLAGVRQKHYSRYKYLDEMRAALERWASYLSELTSRSPG